MPVTILAGRYELIREIGRGASATVYLAHDRALGRDIAIKLVAPALANDPGFVDRFTREARLSAGLSHPNIVTVHDVGESDDHRPFLAIALVDGVSLEDVIAKSAPLPLGEASRILTQLAGALDYLHAQGLIHRDVKPSNVLVEESGRVLLSDFGIAYARESARYTATGILLGTPRYMAPEQMLGEEPTPQTDVYAMGVLAYEMLAGAPPFEGTGTGLMYKIVHEPPPLLRSHAPNIPPGIEAAIARALEKDPTARWSSPGEFAAAFASPDANATFAGPAPVLATAAAAWVTAPPPPPPSPEDPDGPTPEPPQPEPAQETEGPRGSGRRRTLIGAGALGALGLAVASYCLAAGGGSPQREAAAGEPTPTSTATSAPAAAASTTPSATASATSSATSAPSQTPGGAVPPPTAPPQATAPLAATSTSTTAPGVTPSPTFTNTPAPTATSPNTPAPTATATLTPTSTPTPTTPPTATATPSPPIAPSNANLSGNTLTWSDNSNNESGFRIYWRAKNINTNETVVESDKSVGPNTESTTVPDVFLTAVYSDFRRGVAAYNAAGESAIAWAP